MRLTLAFFGFAVGIVGCESSPATAGPFAVEVIVQSDLGRPLSGVTVYLGPQRLGVTDDDGTVRAMRFDAPGTLLRFRCDCPPGFRSSQTNKELRVKDYRGLEPAARLRIDLLCRPELRLAVFVIRVGQGPRVDVFVRGERVARTDAQGVTHFSRRVAAGSEQVVQLRAETKPTPSHASHFFTMPDADEIFVIDQRFQVQRPARSRKSRRRIIKIE